MQAQYAYTPRSCNKYRSINYQLLISRFHVQPRALALRVVSPKAKLDGLEIGSPAPQLALSHETMWSSRLPKASGGSKS
jgi:hypothetical protein